MRNKDTVAEEPSFSADETLPASIFDRVTEVRIRHPEVVEREARRRVKRKRLTVDGKLVLVAVDHAGRGVTQIRSEQLAMADRYQLLARVRRLLEDEYLDGVVGTSDVIEELLILSYLERRRPGRGFLDGRVLVGSMNRGGLAGTVFEMDDSFTCMTAERLAELRCDGGKMLYRLNAQDAASGRTIHACSEAINSLRHHKLAAFVEPLEVKRENGNYHTVKDNAALIRQCGIAAALGESSAHVWLKLPYGTGFEGVCRATTLPILLLGGPAREDLHDTLKDFADGMACSTRVRGAIIGRNLLFPPTGDPLPMCRALTSMAHRGATFQQAVPLLGEVSLAKAAGSNTSNNP
jgi:hypothetical protein